MASDLDALANWLQPLVSALAPAARRTLALQIARDLRTKTQANLRAQTAPDGTAWQARRQAITQAHSVRAGAAKAKQRRGPMMAKLRQTRYLPLHTSADEAGLDFAARVQRIAAIHHFGLPDRVAPGGAEHVYAERPLLGVSDDMAERIKELVVAHLRGE